MYQRAFVTSRISTCVKKLYFSSSAYRSKDLAGGPRGQCGPVRQLDVRGRPQADAGTLCERPKICRVGQGQQIFCQKEPKLKLSVNVFK